MNKKAKSENGVTLLMLIVTVIVMMIIASVTAQSIKKYKATEIPQELVEHSKNAITEADEKVNDIKEGNWSEIINKTGIEDSTEDRIKSRDTTSESTSDTTN